MISQEKQKVSNIFKTNFVILVRKLKIFWIFFSLAVIRTHIFSLVLYSKLGPLDPSSSSNVEFHISLEFEFECRVRVEFESEYSALGRSLLRKLATQLPVCELFCTLTIKLHEQKISKFQNSIHYVTVLYNRYIISSSSVIVIA